MINIDFENLLNNYDENLLDNLRGFGKDNDYLKFWVPGTSPLQSFYNLIDALFESENLEFSIFFIKEKSNKDFINKILIFLEKISVYNQENKDEKLFINIKIDEELYKKFRFKKFVKIQNNKKDIDTKNQISVYKSDKKIIDLYIKNLEKLNPNDYFSNQANNDKNFFTYLFEGHNLCFLIEDKIITKLNHSCDKPTILKKFINLFMDLCLKKNIQEVANHSVIYLEEKIRLVSEEKPNKGIILPSHAGTYFDELNIIVRKVYKEYAEKNSLIFGVNKNYSKKSYNWINLDEEIKFQRIGLVLKNIIKKYGLFDESLSIQNIESNYRIFLCADKSFKKLQEKKNILLEIEIKLKELDDTLEVFIDEVVDKNKIRLKNSPQTKLIN